MEGGNFVDHVKIFCRSGAGGAGSVHFHQDKLTRKGGPDGGNGGRGGSIVLRGDKQFWTLLHLKYRKHIHADNGKNGASALKTGRSGEDIFVDVPLGTVVMNEAGEKLLEVIEHGEEKVLLKGGRGGLGNHNFATPTRQAPQFAQPGEPKQEGWFVFELKLLADVGLVGFPNAGKSTLLSKLSAARPEIADYAFTTLIPQLGIVSYREGKSFVMADLPGIIEGAHEGKGLGHRFLRHIERNAVLLFVIACDCDDIKKEYNTLVRELKMYNPDLLHKERFLIISKSDLVDDELKKMLKKDFPKVPHLFISSHTGEGLDKLKDKLWKILNV